MKVSAPLNKHVPKDIVENLRWRAKVHRLVLEDPSKAEVFRAACAADPLFFINGFCYTLDPRKEPFTKLPFVLYEFQEEAILEILKACNEEDLLIEKSRDIGATWCVIAARTWCFLFKGGLSFLLGSRVDEYVDKKGNPKSLFYKVDYILQNLPPWLLPQGFNWNEHRRQSHIENPENGTVIDGESTTKNFAAGDRRTNVDLDEFARVDIGHSILSATRDVTKSRTFLSTPFGTNNAFYDLKSLPIKRLRLHWTRHPEKARGLYKKENGQYVAIDKEYWDAQENAEEQMRAYDQWILDRGVPLPDDKLRSPWYAEQCKRAATAQEIAQEVDIDYLGSGHQYFKAEKVHEAIRLHARPPLLVGDLEYDYQTGEPTGFREDPNGRLKLWFLLDKNGRPSINETHKFAVGCDVSAGTGASNSAAAGWNERTCEKALELVDPHLRPEAFAVYAVAIGKWLNNACLLWEANGPGRQFGAKVVELGYGNIYLRRNDQSISGKVSDIPGFAPTKESKLLLLGHYRSAVESYQCCNTSKDALEETLEYIFTPEGGVEHARALNKDDPSGARTNHGDRVIADALAWKGITYRKSGPQRETPEIPVGSLAWRNQMRAAQKKSTVYELSPEWRI